MDNQIAGTSDVSSRVKKVGVFHEEKKESNNLNKRAISQTSLHKLKANKSRLMSTPIAQDYNHPSGYIYSQDPIPLQS